MDEREKYIEAGRIAGTALKYGGNMIKVGASMLEVTEKVEEKVLDLGGEFAFPPQISLNEIAAHYCAEPDDKIVFRKGDVAKLDVGVMIDGYIGDNALTVDLGDNEKIVKAAREGLNNALKLVGPGVAISDIGRAIQDTITKYGFAPVRNLSGHALSQYVYHDSPSIPNFDTGDKTRLERGMVIAIEPFASTGAGIIFESSNANIFSMKQKKPVRNMITRQVLKEIESFKDMPFTTRWLTKKFPEPKVNFALRELMQQDMLNSYPPLPDRDGGLVSQAEHTVIVDDDPIITTKI
ncbi:TPA: type II methionyl aminopeptidase [Candidatus Woesearchaeota archaeon]|nr:Methionine aminopeptidase [archaeon GW2011_AR15]MBS3103630.1 type II methionyl aminopeptidase [Candidatus Woesearchaeota archaeon]HIH41770.1 type II methionyl aminopeptidase [Candidatus Woesearchaeota archaeon]